MIKTDGNAFPHELEKKGCSRKKKTVGREMNRPRNKRVLFDEGDGLVLLPKKRRVEKRRFKE